MFPLKEIKKNFLVTSVVYVLLGLLLIVFPMLAFQTICYAMAAALLIAGVVCAIGYFRREVSFDFPKRDLAAALLLIFGAGILAFGADQVTRAIPFLLGIAIVVSGIVKFQYAIDLIRLKYDGWVFILLLALFSVLFGLTLLCLSDIGAKLLIRFLGIGLALSGVTDWITIGCIGKQVRRRAVENSAQDEQV